MAPKARTASTLLAIGALTLPAQEAQAALVDAGLDPVGNGGAAGAQLDGTAGALTTSVGSAVDGTDHVVERTLNRVLTGGSDPPPPDDGGDDGGDENFLGSNDPDPVDDSLAASPIKQLAGRNLREPNGQRRGSARSSGTTHAADRTEGIATLAARSQAASVAQPSAPGTTGPGSIGRRVTDLLQNAGSKLGDTVVKIAGSKITGVLAGLLLTWGLLLEVSRRRGGALRRRAAL